MQMEIQAGEAAATLDTMGGEMVSFRLDGLEYIWKGDPAYWSGHAPVLFPTVGALKGRQTEIAGTAYPMKKHGFARKMQFETAELKKDNATFSLRANDDTRVTYPFDFELRVTHTLSKKGFQTEYTVINTDKRDILFGIGGHAGFSCPLYADTVFSDYAVQFAKAENGPFYYSRLDDCDGVIHREDRVTTYDGTKEIRLDYSIFDKDVLVIDKLQSKKIKLLCAKNGKGIEFSMKGFTSMGLWSPPAKQAPFICLEPWTVNPDFSDATGQFRDKPGITTLAPGKHFSVSYEVKVID